MEAINNYHIRYSFTKKFNVQLFHICYYSKDGLPFNSVGASSGNKNHDILFIFIN